MKLSQKQFEYELMKVDKYINSIKFGTEDDLIIKNEVENKVSMKDMSSIYSIVESSIFDFFGYPIINDLINTKDEAVEVEKILRIILFNAFEKFSEKEKLNGEKKKNN